MNEPDDKKQKPTRRLISTKKEEVTVVVPTLNSLISDATSIIGAELSMYRAKSKRGSFLDLKEARVIANYMDILLKMSKEAREQARADDLSDLSDEELLQLAAQLGKVSSSLPKPAPSNKTEQADEELDP